MARIPVLDVFALGMLRQFIRSYALTLLYFDAKMTHRAWLTDRSIVVSIAVANIECNRLYTGPECFANGATDVA